MLIYTCAHIYSHICSCTCFLTHSHNIHTHSLTHMIIHNQTHDHTYTNSHTCSHTLTHTLSHAYTLTHSHTHAHTHSLYLVISRKVYQMIANYMCFMTESAWSERCVCLTCLRFVVLLGASGFPCMSPLLVRPQTHSFTEALRLRNLSSGLAWGLSWSVHSAGFRGLVFLPCTQLCSPWTSSATNGSRYIPSAKHYAEPGKQKREEKGL